MFSNIALNALNCSKLYTLICPDLLYFFLFESCWINSSWVDCLSFCTSLSRWIPTELTLAHRFRLAMTDTLSSNSSRQNRDRTTKDNILCNKQPFNNQQQPAVTSTMLGAQLCSHAACGRSDHIPGVLMSWWCETALLLGNQCPLLVFHCVLRASIPRANLFV